MNSCQGHWGREFVPRVINICGNDALLRLVHPPLSISLDEYRPGKVEGKEDG